jgi:DNA-binding NtrC family response regulator
MRALRHTAEDLVREPTRAVLVTGPHGIGKEMLAERIHRLGPHGDRPFRMYDARHDQLPTFDARLRGTIVLRHLTAIPLEQQREIHAWATRHIATARLMVTAREDLVGAVTAGQVDDNLYYHVAAWPLHLPALAERTRKDLQALALATLDMLTEGDQALPCVLTPTALDALLRHTWPDNLGELEAVLAVAQLRARGLSAVDVGHLPLLDVRELPIPGASAPLQAVESWHIARVLRAHDGNRTHAARALGISRMTLITKLKTMGDV